MDKDQIVHKMLFDRWYASLKNWDKILAELTDEQLLREVAPGKNRGVYLLGHMIAVHDEMQVLLNIGDKLYPELHPIFLASPDKSVAEIPSVSELRTCWKNQSEVIAQKFAAMHPGDWFEKHTAVSAEDFIKEPHRNKLNIVLTRTTHLNYHTGQLILLK